MFRIILVCLLLSEGAFGFGIAPFVVSANQPVSNQYLNDYSVVDNDHSGDSNDQYLMEGKKYQEDIEKYEKYFSMFGLNAKSIDPDIIQETFMSTVSGVKTIIFL